MSFRPAFAASATACALMSSACFAEVITIGIQETLEPTFFVETMGPTMAHLRRTFPQHTFKTRLLSLNDLSQAIDKKEIELFMADSGFFAYEERRSHARDLATRSHPLSQTPSRTTSATIIVRDDRADLKTLSDLQGKSVAATSNNFSDGWLITQALLQKEGFNPDKFWGKTTFTNYSDLNVLDRVLLRDVDVGILQSCELELILSVRGFRPGSKLRVINPQPNGDLACQRSADLYPGIVFASLPGLDAGLLKALKTAVLQQPLSFGGYDWGVADSYESVNDVYRILRVGPYEYLRELNWNVFKERYLKYVLLLLGVVLLGVVHILRTRRLVRIRTQQLSDALARQAKLEKDARISRQRLSAVERAGVVSQMSALLAHEVMQPLTSLINFSSGLRTYTHQKFGSDTVVDHATNVIAEEAQRISDIVDRVRSYAKNQQSPRERVRISEIVRSALHTFSHTTTADGLSLRTEQRADPHVEVNRLELELVLVNLMKNSATAMANSSEKSLHIILEIAPNDVAVIKVIDTGGAIADETFRQLTLPIASIKEDGLGLGLSLCKSIAERHGGKLEFERLGSGLCAAVKLPISEEPSS